MQATALLAGWDEISCEIRRPSTRRENHDRHDCEGLAVVSTNVCSPIAPLMCPATPWLQGEMGLTRPSVSVAAKLRPVVTGLGAPKI